MLFLKLFLAKRNYRLKLTIFFLFILTASITNVFGQDPFGVRLNQSNGLPSNNVYNVFEDSKGFIWFTTDEGLTRYDGFEYKSYTNQTQSTNAGSCIQEDKFGRLWYENFDGQLFYIENNKLSKLNQDKTVGFLPFGLTEKYVFETIYSIYLPNFKLLEREIKNIGNIKVVEANFSKVSSRFKELEEGKLPNVFNPEFSGGALADLNIYNLHVIYKLFNKPNEINYMANQHENGIDLSGVLTMKYDDKLVICIASKESGNQSRAIIQGDQGFIEVIGGLNRIESLSVHKGKQIKNYKE